MTKNKKQPDAYRRAVIGGVLVTPFIFVLWFIGSLVIYFQTGGSIVGGHDKPTPGRGPAQFLLTLVAIASTALFVIFIYKISAKKQNTKSEKTKTPIRVYLTAIIIPLTVVLCSWAYTTYSEYKNRIPIPSGKETCIKSKQQNADGGYYYSVSCKPIPESTR